MTTKTFTFQTLDKLKDLINNQDVIVYVCDKNKKLIKSFSVIIKDKDTSQTLLACCGTNGTIHSEIVDFKQILPIIDNEFIQKKPTLYFDCLQCKKNIEVK